MPSEPVIKASAITPERCCYITGVLDAARALLLPPQAATVLMLRLGITGAEVHHECVGNSRGQEMRAKT